MDSDNIRELKEKGKYLSVPAGNSMEPLFHDKENVVEIVVPQKPVRPGDIVLFIREDGTSVIHRVVEEAAGGYYIRGDNCMEKEYVPSEKIAGICTRFYIKGRWVSVDDRRYRLYVALWGGLYPVRQLAWKLKKTVRGLIRSE
ncbi:MAG: S24/S26 family peptidase [Eubacterium sp.]|nr:S24/S26 family peptidase [Eubacterium sp.]